MLLTTENADATHFLGYRLGQLLAAGDFVALRGDLGAGKTRFAQGVAAGLAVPADYRVTSPTYTLLNIYPGRLPLYHFDLYRLNGPEDVEILGFSDYFAAEGVCLVEWAERMGEELPAEHLSISFTIVGEELRQLEFSPHGTRPEELLRQLAKDEKTFDRSANSC